MPARKKIGPIHPGEILREDFIEPSELSAIRVARLCGVPRTRIERIVKEEIGITADTALRLGKLFGTTGQFWMNLQARYDLEKAAGDREINAAIRKIEPIRQAAA